MRSKLSSPVVVLALVLSAACLLAGGYYFARNEGHSNKNKRFIIITLDTTRADYLGCYGATDANTPNLDAFADNSVLFENGYSTTNTTIPSHTSIFSSLYMKDHGVENFTYRVPDLPDYLPRLFKEAGYKTAGFTSGGHLDPTSNISQGFDDFDYPKTAERNADQTNKAVFAWLDKNSGSDFFMWVHYFDPHMIYAPPPPFDHMFTKASTDSLSGAPKLHRNKAFLKIFAKYLKQSDDPQYFRNLYKGEISYLDSQLGLLFRKLSELGLYDDCTIIIVADHGESLGEHGTFFNHEGIYDTTIHVPLIFKLPGQAPNGRRKQLASSLDIYPTILGMAEIKPADNIRGKDLSGILASPDSPEVWDSVYCQSVHENYVGIRSHDYTYIRRVHDRLYGGGKRSDIVTPYGVKVATDTASNEELYTNKTDPGQLHDISGEEPGVASAYNAKALTFINDRRSIGSPVEVTDKKHLEKLKSLGYLR